MSIIDAKILHNIWSSKKFPVVDGTSTISEASVLPLKANKSYFIKAYIVGKNYNSNVVEGAYSYELSRSFYRNSAGTIITQSSSEIVLNTSANPYSITFTPSIEVKDASSIKVSITYSASSAPKNHYWEVTLLWREL
jgi:hypothetical protein